MIELLPFGKENKISKRKLMIKANLSEEDFNKELAKIRETYIIMTDTTSGGYWRSNNKQELQDFIRKYQKRAYTNSKMIMLAYKELEEMEGKTK